MNPEDTAPLFAGGENAEEPEAAPGGTGDGESGLPPFERDLARLEAIVTRLEEGGLNLDDSLKLFAEGQELLARCRAALEKAEVKVRRLLEGGGSEEIDPESLGR